MKYLLIFFGALIAIFALINIPNDFNHSSSAAMLGGLLGHVIVILAGIGFIRAGLKKKEVKE